MMGLRYECLGRKGQGRPRKGQEGPTETETSPGTVAAGPGQYIYRFPVGTRGYANVILGRTPVYWRRAKGRISISPAVLQGY
jgi:hypothetical protein